MHGRREYGLAPAGIALRAGGAALERLLAAALAAVFAYLAVESAVEGEGAASRGVRRRGRRGP